MKNKIASILFIVLISISLISCSEKKVEQKDTAKNTKTDQVTKPEKTQEEIDKETKSKAVQSNFVEINGHEAEMKDKIVFAEGQISAVDNAGSVELFKGFTLSQKEGDGYGMYYVYNFTSDTSFKDGDIVKVYGSVYENKSTLGMPIIVGTVIEKK